MNQSTFVLKNILSPINDHLFHIDNYEINDLEHTDIIQFVLDKSGYAINDDSLHNFYVLLSANAISASLMKEELYWTPKFENSEIYNLFEDKNDEEYLMVFNYFFDKIDYLELHGINHTNLFFGNNLKIEYHLLISIFADLIFADLNNVLNKVKMKIYENSKPKDWYLLYLGKENPKEKYSDFEKERIDGIIKGVLL